MTSCGDSARTLATVAATLAPRSTPGMMTEMRMTRLARCLPLESSTATPRDKSSHERRPWYKDGLQFTCTRCANCCTGAPGYVWVNEEELQAIAEFRGESVEEVTGLYTRMARRGRTLRDNADGDCGLLRREQGCTIYALRRAVPTWPFWHSNVERPRPGAHLCGLPRLGQGAVDLGRGDPGAGSR